jgi:hypothetical protein
MEGLVKAKAPMTAKLAMLEAIRAHGLDEKQSQRLVVEIVNEVRAEGFYFSALPPAEADEARYELALATSTS